MAHAEPGAHAHTHVHVAFTFGATEVRGNQRATRRGQRRAEVYKEEKPHFPGGQGIPFSGESDSNSRFLSLDPGTDCPVTQLIWLQNYAFPGVQLRLDSTAVSDKGGMST